MARTDSSPKAIVKAAVRTNCHKIARRYENQNLESLHGSNVKWLVLADELFDEVCSDFTVRRLDISRAAKRSLFDAEWVSQITYELVTKPARPRRAQLRRSQEQLSSPVQESGVEFEVSFDAPSATTGCSTLMPSSQFSDARGADYRPSPCRFDSATNVQELVLPCSATRGTASGDLRGLVENRPSWIDTILN